MVARGQHSMAVYLLMLVSTYARPSELLRMKKVDLVPPASGVTSWWAVLLNPSEGESWSKTGAEDESLYLDSRWMAWANPVWAALKQGRPGDKVFGFSYPQFSVVFKECLTDLNLESVVPYQTRHSGPSIDLSRGERSLVDIRRRGRWRAHRSLVRYEKSGRLAKTWNALSRGQQVLFQKCEAGIADVVLGRRTTGLVLPGRW